MITKNPVPVLYIKLNGIGKGVVAEFNHVLLLVEISKLISTEIVFYKFRGVSYSRLDYVIQKGVDVDPTDGVISAESFSKAYEYGGWPKVILVFDPLCVDRTFREIPTDTPEKEIRRLKEAFTTLSRSRDGEKLWLSRLPENDPRIASSYEIAYAAWIPGNPLDAIAAILILGHEGDVDLDKVKLLVDV